MSLGPLELAMLAAIALLFFGPAKLPQLGKSLGDAIRGFKSAMNDISTPPPPETPKVEDPVEQVRNYTATKEKDKTPHS